MKTPKTPIEFDYDLWTTEDGKCMVRVKITGEVTEVDRKVMRILRAEEKRLRRSKQGVPISGTEGKTAEERASVLSLSYVSYEGCEDLEPYWLIDSSSMEESVMFWMSEKEFRATLPILFGAFYGLRRSEAIGLKWDAIDFDQNTITIRHTVTSCDLDGKRVLVASDTTKTKSSMRTLPLVPFILNNDTVQEGQILSEECFRKCQQERCIE